MDASRTGSSLHRVHRYLGHNLVLREKRCAMSATGDEKRTIYRLGVNESANNERTEIFNLRDRSPADLGAAFAEVLPAMQEFLLVDRRETATVLIDIRGDLHPPQLKAALVELFTPIAPKIPVALSAQVFGATWVPHEAHAAAVHRMGEVARELHRGGFSTNILHAVGAAFALTGAYCAVAGQPQIGAGLACIGGSINGTMVMAQAFALWRGSRSLQETTQELDAVRVLGERTVLDPTPFPRASLRCAVGQQPLLDLEITLGLHAERLGHVELSRMVYLDLNHPAYSPSLRNLFGDHGETDVGDRFAAADAL